jgi:hypothetical protein
MQPEPKRIKSEQQDAWGELPREQQNQIERAIKGAIGEGINKTKSRRQSTSPNKPNNNHNE